MKSFNPFAILFKKRESEAAAKYRRYVEYTDAEREYKRTNEGKDLNIYKKENEKRRDALKKWIKGCSDYELKIRLEGLIFMTDTQHELPGGHIDWIYLLNTDELEMVKVEIQLRKENQARYSQSSSS